tara:strand:+ start:221 stop:652 length:432 start_codon:yes stop_codon:yes gene_type:complete
MTRAEYEADLVRRGVKQSSLSADQAAEINQILNRSEFRSTADGVWDGSNACKCEASALRVYEIKGQGYFLQKIGDRTGGLRLNNIPATSPYSGWRHVFDWHPHIRGTALPSGSDLSTSFGQGTANAIQYNGSGSTILYRGIGR